MKPNTDTHFPALPLPHVADITCMDPNRTPGLVAEKLSKTLRFIAFFIQNGVSKSKMVHDVQDVVKRGKNIGKALTCHPRDPHVSFVSPLEYQFSCSGSPPRLSYTAARRKLSPSSSSSSAALRRSPAHLAVRMCRGGATAADGIIARRRVNITGSAAPMLKHVEKDFHVDEAAEEFIDRFYRELRLQQWLDHYC